MTGRPWSFVVLAGRTRVHLFGVVGRIGQHRVENLPLPSARIVVVTAFSLVANCDVE
jgi:hypothetical protein